MEQWQLDALTVLLETQVKEVEPGQRIYTSSSDSSNLYHLVDKKYDGIQIEQVDTSEKWNKRVNLYSDEIPALLKTLLMWYLDDVHQKQQQATAPAFLSDDIGDLDDHPF